MNFKPPDAKEQTRAISELASLPEKFRKVFSPQFDFQSIPPAQHGDWLDINSESGQIFSEYVKLNPLKPSSERHKIYLQPLGNFDPFKIHN